MSAAQSQSIAPRFGRINKPFEIVDEDSVDRITAAQQAALEAQEEQNRRLSKQGYSALGYSAGTDGVAYYVWSKIQNSVYRFTETSLSKPASIRSAFGPEFVAKRFTVQLHDKDGKPTKSYIDYNTITDTIINECTDRGPWSEQAHTREVGVWPDDSDPDSLIVNCRDGLLRVAGENVEQIQRHDPASKWIYTTTAMGRFSAEEASEEDVWQFLDLFANGWNWATESDSYLTVGWALNQAYVGVQDARPSLYLTGASGSGKSHVESCLACHAMACGAATMLTRRAYRRQCHIGNWLQCGGATGPAPEAFAVDMDAGEPVMAWQIDEDLRFGAMPVERCATTFMAGIRCQVSFGVDVILSAGVVDRDNAQVGQVQQI